MLNRKIYVNSISVIAPGMEKFSEWQDILKDHVKWSPIKLSKMVPSALPANEARRTTTVIRLALKAIESIKHGANISAVFASSEGDLDITDKICKALATEEKMVSPTLFHNSVHNAPAGYFSIAANMKTPSISLSAGDNTFSAGLIEAVTQVLVENNDVLLVAYDNITPEDLDSFRHFDYPISIALLLSVNKQSSTIASIDVSVINEKMNVTQCFNNSLEVIRVSNPIGLGLPLVESLVRGMNTDIIIPYLNQNQLLIKVKS
ncbi:MAG: beta-ketoacyl synthase chain length factor [Gammaproteobacteria bacterium]|nr:beta-ketoacyl synthase chain length factor [Gammaproteobacteria bacterium]